MMGLGRMDGAEEGWGETEGADDGAAEGAAEGVGVCALTAIVLKRMRRVVVMIIFLTCWFFSWMTKIFYQ